MQLMSPETNVVCWMPNVKKVEPFVGGYLRSFYGHRVLILSFRCFDDFPPEVKRIIGFWRRGFIEGNVLQMNCTTSITPDIHHTRNPPHHVRVWCGGCPLLHAAWWMSGVKDVSVVDVVQSCRRVWDEWEMSEIASFKFNILLWQLWRTENF